MPEPTTPTRATTHNDTTSPSPLKAQHRTPPTNKAQTYYHEPDGKPRHKIETPGGSIQALPRFPGVSHQVGMRNDGTRYIEEDFDTASTFAEQWECLLLSLSNLRNRANQDFKRYERSFSPPYPAYDWSHHQYTRFAIETCLSKIKTCLNSTQTNIDVMDELNTSIREGRIYNPFGLRTIYPDDSIYAYNAAQKTWIFTGPLHPAGFKHITPYTQALPHVLVVKTTTFPPPFFFEADEATEKPSPTDAHSPRIFSPKDSEKKRSIDETKTEEELREKLIASFKRKK